MWYPLWKLKADRPEFKSQLWHFLAVCSWPELLNLSYFVCKMLTAMLYSWRNCLMSTGLWSLNTDACCSCHYKPPLRETWNSSKKARGKSRSRQKWHTLYRSISVDTAKYSATPMSPGRESILFEKLKKIYSEKKTAVRKNKFESQIHLSTSKLFHFQRLHLPVCREAGRIKISGRKKKKNKYFLKRKKKWGDTVSNWTVSWQTSESCCSYGRTGETS